MANTVWTDEHVALLRSMVEGKHTGNEISAALPVYSRQAVNSKAARLGLQILRPIGVTSSGGVMWSDEELERFKSLILEGKTGREIATLLGRPRNSIMGRARRMGMSVGQRGPRKKVAVAERKKAHIWERSPKNAIGTNPITLHDGALTCEPVGLPDLARNACRWPVGDASGYLQMFCGAPSGVDGGSYCPAHNERAIGAHITPEQRKRYVRAYQATR